MSRAICLACTFQGASGRPMSCVGTVQLGGKTFEHFRCSACEKTVALPPEMLDVRPVRPDARETFDLFAGARQRGFTEAQIEYLGGCVGITWAKAFRAGQKAGPET
jgi:hypothetical protein